MPSFSVFTFFVRFVKTTLGLLIIFSVSVQLTYGQSQKDEFTISIFWPPVWKHTNDAQYKTLSESHVDCIQNVSSTDLNTLEKNMKMLELAHKYGMKIHDSVKKIDEISKKTGDPERLPFHTKEQLFTDSFLPGEGKLYIIHE